jgi:hypothetical protein
MWITPKQEQRTGCPHGTLTQRVTRRGYPANGKQAFSVSVPPFLFLACCWLFW